MKKNNFEIGKGSSIFVIATSCIAVLLLMVYVGVSISAKGTFSTPSSFTPGQVYCWVHPQTNHTIKEKVYITDCDESTGICHGRLYEENINMDYGDPQVVANNVYNYSELHDANYWACEKNFISTYMCDNYGQIAYIAGCRKYDENANDANYQQHLSGTTNTASNANNVMCGVMGYYLYRLSELSDISTCIFSGASVVSSYPGEQHVSGVSMCDLGSNTVVSITSCNNDANNKTCFNGIVSSRPTGEFNGTTPPKGYSYSNLADADNPACSLKKCYKCEQKGNTILPTTDTPKVTTVHGGDTCPDGYTEEEITSCYKNCIYCSDGEIKDISVYIGYACTGGAGKYEDTPENRASIDCSHYTGPGTGPTPTYTESVICYRCSPTPEERLFTDTTTCPSEGGWIEGNLNCSGGNTSGGNTSGGNTSGGNTSGGNTSGGNTSGGNTSGGNTSGGNTSGGNTSGGNNTTTKTCHKCTNDGYTTKEDTVCDSNEGWFSSEPKCCWTCESNQPTRVSIPSSMTCGEFAGYENTSSELTCSGTGGNTSGGNTSGGNTSGGNTSGGNTSGGNTSGGNTTDPVPDVKAEKNNTQTKEATIEVSKIVDKISNGETVSGVSSSLKTKIEEAISNEQTMVVAVETTSVKESNVSSDAEKVKAKIDSDDKVAAYYDVDVVIKVDGTKIGNVTQLEDTITVSLPIPTNIPDVANGYKRKYKIVRVHNGTATVITPTVSGSNLLFETNKFSTYAVVYEDEYQGGSNNNNNNNNNNGSSSSASGQNSNNVENPQTGSLTFIVALLVGLAAIGYAVYYFTMVDKVKD